MSPRARSDIIGLVDIFLTPRAELDLALIRMVRPAAGTWGVVFGHDRGGRIYIEGFSTAGRKPPADPAAFFATERGRSGYSAEGIFVIGRSADWKKAVLGPAFCGRLFVEIGPAGGSGAAGLKFFRVAYNGAFRLEPVPAAGKA